MDYIHIQLATYVCNLLSDSRDQYAYIYVSHEYIQLSLCNIGLFHYYSTMACVIEICCGVVGPGCTSKVFKREDDPFCLKRFFTFLYLLIRYGFELQLQVCMVIWLYISTYLHVAIVTYTQARTCIAICSQLYYYYYKLLQPINYLTLYLAVAGHKATYVQLCIITAYCVCS